MAETMYENPNLVMKLSSSSMNISAAVAKLMSYNLEILEEKRKDKDFYLQMKNSFKQNAEINLGFAETLIDVSDESDVLVKGDESNIE